MVCIRRNGELVWITEVEHWEEDDFGFCYMIDKDGNRWFNMKSERCYKLDTKECRHEIVRKRVYKNKLMVVYTSGYMEEEEVYGKKGIIGRMYTVDLGGRDSGFLNFRNKGMVLVKRSKRALIEFMLK